jgi:hypothetical protein
MKASKVTACILATMAIAICPAIAVAAPITGTDFGAGPTDARPNSNAAAAIFDAQAALIGPFGIITFEDKTVGNFSSLTVATGVTVTFSNTDTIGGISTVSSVTTGYNTTSGGTKMLRFVPITDIGTCSVTFTFDSPVRGFGAYLTGVSTESGILHAVYNDGTANDLYISGDVTGGVQFFGVIAQTQSISSFKFELRGVTGRGRDIIGIDDVRVLPLQTPEPATLAMLGLGGLALIRRPRA